MEPVLATSNKISFCITGDESDVAFSIVAGSSVTSANAPPDAVQNQTALNAADVPSGFEQVLFVRDLGSPISVIFAPYDRLFVSEKLGLHRSSHPESDFTPRLRSQIDL